MHLLQMQEQEVHIPISVNYPRSEKYIQYIQKKVKLYSNQSNLLIGFKGLCLSFLCI